MNGDEQRGTSRNIRYGIPRRYEHAGYKAH